MARQFPPLPTYSTSLAYQTSLPSSHPPSTNRRRPSRPTFSDTIYPASRRIPPPSGSHIPSHPIHIRHIISTHVSIAPDKPTEIDPVHSSFLVLSSCLPVLRTPGCARGVASLSLSVTDITEIWSGLPHYPGRIPRIDRSSPPTCPVSPNPSSPSSLLASDFHFPFVSNDPGKVEQAFSPKYLFWRTIYLPTVKGDDENLNALAKKKALLISSSAKHLSRNDTPIPKDVAHMDAPHTKYCASNPSGLDCICNGQEETWSVISRVIVACDALEPPACPVGPVA